MFIGSQKKASDKNSEVRYDPTKKNYDPIKDATWQHMEK